MKKVLAAVLAAAMSLSMASVAMAFDAGLSGGTTTGTSGKSYAISLDNIKDKMKLSLQDSTGKTAYLYNYKSGDAKIYFDITGYKFADIDVHVAKGDIQVKKQKLDDGNMLIVISPKFGYRATKEDWSVDVEVEHSNHAKDKTFVIEGQGAYSTVQEVYSGAKLRSSEASATDDIGVGSGEDVGCMFEFGEALYDTTRIRCHEYVDLYFNGNYDTKVENLHVATAVPKDVEEYFGDVDVDCYNFDAKPKFAKSVDVIIDADEDSIIYEYDEDGELTRLDVTYSSDGWKFSTKKLGCYIIAEEEYPEGNAKDEPTKEPVSEPTETPADKSNPGTGANDMVGAAAALAVVSLVAAGAVAFKKASK